MKNIDLGNDIKLLTRNVRDILFEGMWEVPHGVTLNSYIIKGEETAVIDGFCGWDGFPESFFKLLNECEIEPKSLKHLIVNHVEPDHTGWIEDLKKITEDFTIYCTKEAKMLLQGYYGTFNNIVSVNDGDTLDLGGRVLKFIKTPNVHWPDTMMTYDENSKTLFSCDCFGSFGELDRNVDTHLSDDEIHTIEHNVIRYYSNVLGLFSTNTLNAIKKVEDLDVDLIAPGHGILFKNNIPYIKNKYTEIATYQKEANPKKALIIWGSMYGMSESAIPIVEAKLKENGMDVDIVNSKETDIGSILALAWEAKTIAIVCPTYEYAMFPPVASVLDELTRKKIQNRDILYFGSCGWSGGALKELKELIENKKMAWEIKAALEFRGGLTEANKKKIEDKLNEALC